jgi:hypothetical protein
VPPTITSLSLRGTGDAVLSVTASDTSGIARIVVLRLLNGVIAPVTVNAGGATSGTFTVSLGTVADGEDLVVQVQDGACNVSAATAKGANLSLIRVDAGPDQGLATPDANVFPIKIANFASLSSPLFVLWDFGDGSFASKTITAADVTIDGSGTATYTVSHVYAAGSSTPITASVRVTDSGGGLGGDDVVIHCDTLGETSKSGADLADCATSNDASTLSLTMVTVGAISKDVQYRVTLIAGSRQFDLRYSGGKLQGPSSLRATVTGNRLVLTMRLSDIGATAGTPIKWSVEAQSGVKGEPTSGFPDRMPNSGSIAYTVR